MGEYITQYRIKIDELLSQKEQETDWENLIREHLIRIGFFQHERLIHLIVTMTVAILTCLCAGLAVLTSNLPAVLLTVLFAVLLVPYILHYYLLENEVQKMYRQYETMLDFVKETQNAQAFPETCA